MTSKDHSDQDIQNINKLIELEDKFGAPSMPPKKVEQDKSQLTPEDLMNYFLLHKYSNELGIINEYSSRLRQDVSSFGLKFVNSFSSSNSSKLLFRSSYHDTDNLRGKAEFQLWLNLVMKKANLSLAGDNNIEFKSLEKRDLKSIAELSGSIDNIPLITSELRKKGIILVFEPPIKAMKTDAALTLFNDNIPIIGMTLRYSRVDYFWYTLMHELAHIVLHLDYLKENTYINDDLEQDRDDINIEKEADKLAAESFIPRSHWRRTSAYKREDKSSIYETAKRFKIHPSIVAGRLRKEKNQYDIFSDIVSEHNVRDILDV